MKRIFSLATLSIFILLSSCGKDAPDSNSSDAISAEIDGVRMTFNVNATAVRTSLSGSEIVQIIGFHGEQGASEQIAVGLTGALTTIKAGVYTEDAVDPGHSGGVTYFIPNAFYPYGPSLTSSNPCSITVTSISATSIQGTFKGNVYLYDGAGPTTTRKVITNGQFNLKF